MKSLGRTGIAAFAGIGLCANAFFFGAEAVAGPWVPLPLGGPVCAGGVAVLTGPAPDGAVLAGAPGGAVVGGGAPAEATLVDTTTAVAGAPCGPAAADLTTLAGPVVPMALPGPVPPVPIAPIPVLPGALPPVPLVAPGPAGAAAASPIAGVLTDAIGAPIGLAGGTK